MAWSVGVRFRKHASRLLTAVAILFTAFVSVGLTAPADGPFAIIIRPVLWQLGVDVDIKLGRFHFHERWAAIPEPEPTTKRLVPGL